MQSVKAQIAQHAADINAMTLKIHQTFRKRDTSPQAYAAWQAACHRFHAHTSRMDIHLARMTTEALRTDPDLRDLAFAYLHVDPHYFRSGYTKEHMLRQIKRLTLSAPEQAVLRDVIQRRIQTGALREFRRFCRLIPQIQTAPFVQSLRDAAKSEDANVARRALFALRYVHEDVASAR